MRISKFLKAEAKGQMNFTAGSIHRTRENLGRWLQKALYISVCLCLLTGICQMALATSGKTTVVVELKGLASDDGQTWRTLSISGRFDVMTEGGDVLGRVRANPSQEQKDAGESNALVIEDSVVQSVLLVPVAEDFHSGFVCQDNVAVNIVENEQNTTTIVAYAQQGLFAVHNTIAGANRPAAQAEYMVLDAEGNFNQSFSTDEQGMFTSKKAVPTGEYQLVQMRCAEGTLPNQEPRLFSVQTFYGSPEDVSQVIVESEPIPDAQGQAAVVLSVAQPFAQEQDSDTDTFFASVEIAPSFSNTTGLSMCDFTVMVKPEALLDSQEQAMDAQGSLMVESLTARIDAKGYGVLVQGLDGQNEPVGRPTPALSGEQVVLANGAVGAQVTYVNAQTGEAVLPSDAHMGSIVATVLYHPLDFTAEERHATQALLSSSASYALRYPAADGNGYNSAQGQSAIQNLVLVIPDGRAALSVNAVADVDSQGVSRLVLSVESLSGEIQDDVMLAATLPDSARVDELRLSADMRLLRTPQRDVVAFYLQTIREENVTIPLKAGEIGSLVMRAYDAMNLPMTADNPQGAALAADAHEADPLLDALIAKVDAQYAALPCFLSGNISLPEAKPCDTVILTGTMYEDRDQSGSRTKDEEALAGHGVLLRGQQSNTYYGSLTDADGIFEIYAEADTVDTTGTLLTMLPKGAMSTGSYITGMLQRKVATLPDEDYPLSYIMMGAIQGKVLLDNGTPLSATQMILWKDDAPIRTTATDSLGAYRFSMLSEGKYMVSMELAKEANAIPASQEGFTQMGSKMSAQVELAYGQQATQDFAAVSLGSVQGMITQDEQLLADVTVSLAGTHGGPLTAQTNDQGAFSFEGVPQGEYQLSFTLPDGVSVIGVNGERVSGQTDYKGTVVLTSDGPVHQNIQVGKVATLQGRIPSALEGQTVTAASLTGQVSGSINAEGSFVLAGLTPGDYTIYAPLAPGKTIAQDNPWKVTQKGDMIWLSWTVEAGQDQWLPNVEFQELTSIEGLAYVDDNGDHTYAQGKQLMSGVAVALQKKEGDTWQDVTSSQTNEYGAYCFRDLGEGTYRVASMANTEGLFVASVGGEPRPVGSGGVMVSDELPLTTGTALKGVADIALGQPSALFFTAFADSNENGTRGEYERPITGVLVEVVEESGTVVASGTTDGAGELKISSVRPGSFALKVTLPEGYRFTVVADGKGAGVSCAASEDMTATSVAMPFAAGQTVEAGVGAVPVGSFSGKVWSDDNNNGIMDPEELGVGTITLTLAGKKTGKTYTIVTEESGEFRFDRLPNDTYVFSAELPDGFLFAKYTLTGGNLRSVFTVEGTTGKREFPLTDAADVTNKNVGVISKGIIDGVAFLDLNYNGMKDEGEPGYKGVTLELIKISNTKSMGKVVTDEEGRFAFEDLRGGDYRLRAILPEDGSIFTRVPAEQDALANRFEQRENRRENSLAPVTIGNGGKASTLVGVARGAAIKGAVFQDNNYDGMMKGKEKKHSGVRVELRDESGAVVANTLSVANGNYMLDGIMPGTYTLAFLRKEGHAFSRFRPAEEGGNWVKGLDGEYGITEPIEVLMGEEKKDINAGMLTSSTVAGLFFDDLNDNGMQDEGELGMEDVQVRLYSQDAEIDLTVPVQADGHYFFDGVMPGKYTLTYLLPEHVELARVVKDGNTLENKGRETSTQEFAIESGTENQRPLVGAVRLGTFVGYLFHDSNANGLQDESEERMSGLQLAFTPDREDLEAITAQADSEGNFSITDLRPASYQMDLKLPEGYIYSANIQTTGIALDTAAEQQMKCPWQVLIGRQENAIGAVQPGMLKGYVWLDENRDGAQAAEEALLPKLAFELVDEAQNKVVKKAASGEDGQLTFVNVRPGQYTLRFTIPPQSEPAGEQDATFAAMGGAMSQSGIIINEGETFESIHAGLVCRTSIGGAVALDENGQKSNLEGITVKLYQEGTSEPVQTAATKENGSYRFDGLWPANYTLTCELPQAMIFVRPDDPNYEAGTSVIVEANGTEGTSAQFALQMAKNLMQQNVLFIRPAKVGDMAWLDSNKNGLLDGGEPVIPGLTVQLLASDGQVAEETTTNAYGYYLFENVYPGTYTLQVKGYAELAITKGVPELRMISSCLTSGDGASAQSDPFSVVSGTVNLDYDLGYVLLDGKKMPEAIVLPPTKDWTGSYVSGGGR